MDRAKSSFAKPLCSAKRLTYFFASFVIKRSTFQSNRCKEHNHKISVFKLTFMVRAVGIDNGEWWTES